jgi:hypothetical protein
MKMTCINNHRLEQTRSTHGTRKKCIQRYCANAYSEKNKELKVGQKIRTNMEFTQMFVKGTSTEKQAGEKNEI